MVVDNMAYVPYDKRKGMVGFTVIAYEKENIIYFGDYSTDGCNRLFQKPETGK